MAMLTVRTKVTKLKFVVRFVVLFIAHVFFLILFQELFIRIPTFDNIIGYMCV